jgi:triosephosphate isomerase
VKLSGNTENFLSEQLDVLTSDDLDFITIAYEPIWAIGTGLNADNKYIQSIHLFIKDYLNKLNKEKNISVVYGGSVKLDNCEDILSCNNVDGLLIGGASLDPDTFSKIYNLS